MRISTALLSLAVLLPACHSAIHAQAASQTAPQFSSLAPIAFDNSGPVIRAHTETLKPFTVAGERGVLLGQQDGSFEAWVLPVKLLSHMTIEAEIEGYSVPIDVNQQSAEIEVRPDRTVITYSHVGFTVRQIMFSPESPVSGAQSLTGPVVLFEFDCLHPTDFTFRFTPNLEYMWPERNEGHPGPEWVAPSVSKEVLNNTAESSSVFLASSGYYVLHADYPDLAGAVTIPDAQPGIMAPYQERPQVYPVEMKLHIDPARDRGQLYPLLMAVGTNKDAAGTRALGDTLAKLNQGLASAYAAHADSYKKLLANSVSIDTPDKALNEAFQWAEMSIEQLKAKPFCDTTASGHECADETALVAGYYSSGDSARPGFGWFFGRDALYTLYAVNGYGDFGLTRSELEFLMHRQRADGKIMHEYSQTATQIDWLQFPYMYAAADSTPLFILAMYDYVRASGDVDFLQTNKDAVEKAWAFETGHAPDAAHGGNGIYTNEQGTGWVESWPGGMPHQEIYLALLDQQASAAMAQIYKLLHDEEKFVPAQKRANTIADTINRQFDNGDKGCYAFSRNKDGSLDRTTTVYPALAWWSDASLAPHMVMNVGPPAPAPGSILMNGDACLQQLASHTLNTDWGLRDVSNEEKIYDGMSYHQGSVWPLFTGWAALAEYRGNQPLAGYQMLIENANLTWAQDLGSDTELLSGDYFVPFGRSTSHQLWSSAMVITPTLRGLFGITIDAQTKTITVNPHLPASWENASAKHLRLTDGETDVYVSRKGGRLDVALSTFGPKNWKLRSDMPGASSSADINGEVTVHIPLPTLEVDPELSHERNPKVAPLIRSWTDSPSPGSSTQRCRVLHEEYSEHKLTLLVEGSAGSAGVVGLVRHAMIVPHLKWQLAGSSDTSASYGGVTFLDTALHDPNEPMLLTFHFPKGEGWKTITVTLTW
jgi:glycogen debranching enzyme